MAKLTGPLLSKKASGSIGEELTYSERKSGSQVRFQRKQKTDVLSWSRADEQSLYRLIYSRWLSFSASEKKVYNDEAKAKNLGMSGWNLFFKYARLSPKNYLGLAGYWSMNRTGFGTVLDLSKNNNPCTLLPSYPSNSPQYVASKNKKLSSALRFDGVNDYLDSSVPVKVPNGFTFLVWWKCMKFTVISNHCIVCNINGVGVGNYLFVTYNGLNFRGQINIGPSSYSTVLMSLTSSDWHQIGFMWDGFFVYPIRDGVIGVGTPASGVLSTGSNKIKIGTLFSGAWQSNGIIDDALIYNRALSASEILNLYNLSK